MREIQVLFINNMKMARLRHSLSQAQLAERCGLSPNYIAELESGRRFPSADTFQKLCDSLSMRPYQLFLGDDDRKTLGRKEPPDLFKERLRQAVINVIKDFR